MLIHTHNLLALKWLRQKDQEFRDILGCERGEGKRDEEER